MHRRTFALGLVGLPLLVACGGSATPTVATSGTTLATATPAVGPTQTRAAELGQVEALPARGFDADFATRSKKLFSRDAGHRFAVKVVPHVDRQTVKDAWTAAQKAQAPICVFLMGSGIAPIGELAEAIGELRKRTRTESAISVVPIDLRDWSAHIPADAPASCRNVLKRLRDASVV